MHFILSEQDSPNRIEFDSTIFFDEKHFTAAAHFWFLNVKLKKVNLTVLCTIFQFPNYRTVTSSSNT